MSFHICVSGINGLWPPSRKLRLDEFSVFVGYLNYPDDGTILAKKYQLYQ